MDASSLSSITQAEFETNVEKAILDLPVDPAESTLRFPKPSTTATISASSMSRQLPPLPPINPTDLTTTTTDADSPALLQQPGLSFPDATKAFLIRSSDSVERIVSKPLGAIGRIFDQFEQIAGEIPGATVTQHNQQPPSTNNQPHPSSSPSQRSFPLPPPPPPGVVGTNRRSYQPYQSARGPAPPLPGMGMGPGGGRGPPVQDQQRNPKEGWYAREGATAEEVTREIDRQHEQQRIAALEVGLHFIPSLVLVEVELIRSPCN